MLSVRETNRAGVQEVGLLRDAAISDGDVPGMIEVIGKWVGQYPYFPNRQVYPWDLYDEYGRHIATNARSKPVGDQIDPIVGIVAIRVDN